VKWRWLWWLRRAEPQEPPDNQQALEALATSALKLETAKAQAPRVNRAVSEATAWRRRNNFAALFEAALREQRR